MDHAGAFDVLEVTLDHYFWGSARQRARVEELAGPFPLVAHGIGLSLGSDAPPDLAYLDRVADAVERLGMGYYSEHIAFTKMLGGADVDPRSRREPASDQPRDIANLMPLPRTEATVEMLVRHIGIVRERVPRPLLLEYITYYWDWADSHLDDATWFNTIFEATGASMLLDVENLWVNGRNHTSLDPSAFIRALQPGVVKALHLAGGRTHAGGAYGEPEIAPVEVDTHDSGLRAGTLDLLREVLAHHAPETIILERDTGFEDEADRAGLLADMERIRDIVAETARGRPDHLPGPGTASEPERYCPARSAAPSVGSNRRLAERQAAVLEYLLDPHAFGAGRSPDTPPPDLAGIDPERLKISGLFSMGKRQQKIKATLPLTWAALAGKPVYNFYDFCHRFPQADATRLTNARDFVAYLETGWAQDPPDPPWLPDLATFELALASATSEGAAPGSPLLDGEVAAIGGGLARRRPDVLSVALDHDIRALLGGTGETAMVEERAVSLAIVPSDEDAPRVFELSQDLGGLLNDLDDWSPLDPSDVDRRALVEQLARAGMVDLVP